MSHVCCACTLVTRWMYMYFLRVEKHGTGLMCRVDTRTPFHKGFQHFRFVFGASCTSDRQNKPKSSKILWKMVSSNRLNTPNMYHASLFLLEVCGRRPGDTQKQPRKTLEVRPVLTTAPARQSSISCLTLLCWRANGASGHLSIRNLGSLHFVLLAVN